MDPGNGLRYRQHFDISTKKVLCQDIVQGGVVANGDIDRHDSPVEAAVKRSSRYFILLQSVLYLSACASADSGPTQPLDPTAEIQGTVRSAENGTLLAGVSLELSPGDRSAVTDAEGRFTFSSLTTGVTYQLTTRREDFANLTMLIELTGEDNPLTVDLALPPFTRIDPPAGELRVWSEVISGFGLRDPSITFRLQLENRGSGALRNLVVTDSLDARADGYRLKREDVSIDDEAFPGAQLEIQEDGRSFLVTMELDPTTSPVELLRITIPTPAEVGVYCNRVGGTATGEIGPTRHDDSSCLAGGI